MYPRAREIRKSAWAVLRGGRVPRWGIAIFAFVMTALLTLGSYGDYVIYSLKFVSTNAILAGTVRTGFLFSLIFGVATILLEGTFLFGTAHIHLGFVRNADVGYGDFFDGFKQFGRTLGLFWLNVLFTFLWALLFIVPGIVKAISYSQSFYILHDHPELSPNEARIESMRMMSGHKGRFFCLGLSFFGWVLLSVLTLGILMLWISPVMECSNAIFYENLRANDMVEYNQTYQGGNVR